MRIGDHLVNTFLLHCQSASELQHQIHKELAFNQCLFPFASSADRIHTIEFPVSTNNLIENGSFEGTHYPSWLRCLSNNFHPISQVTSDTHGASKSSERTFPENLIGNTNAGLPTLFNMIKVLLQKAAML